MLSRCAGIHAPHAPGRHGYQRVDQPCLGKSHAETLYARKLSKFQQRDIFVPDEAVLLMLAPIFLKMLAVEVSLSFV